MTVNVISLNSTCVLVDWAVDGSNRTYMYTVTWFVDSDTNTDEFRELNATESGIEIAGLQPGTTYLVDVGAFDESYQEIANGNASNTTCMYLFSTVQHLVQRL